jgi:Protein of unknown function (DUF2855)
MNTRTFLVDKTDLSQTRLETVPSVPLQSGQLRLGIERFALTSNNITYASFGQAMAYWDFYPRAGAWGVIPVWGFAQVLESACEGIEAGERFYGYFPMGNEVVLTPAQVSPQGFTVTEGQRAQLAAVYNQYSNCAQDTFYPHGSEALQCLLRPLFVTSWLIDDFLVDQGFFGSEAVLLSSASSKTAYGAAFCLAQRQAGQRPRILGLTSASNLAFCQSLGCYDEVLTYEDLPQLPVRMPCTYVDMAGNAALRLRLHSHLQNLRYSCSVGGTHVRDLGNAKDLPGPRPTLFFAPAQIAKRRKDWGGAALNQRLVDSWQAFVQRVTQPGAAWLEVETHGLPSAEQAYRRLLAGQCDPRSGQVWSL